MPGKLTPQQQQAVDDRGGKLLVSAAAGSGKTKVLVDRLLSYITDPINPANIDDFLIITYTKAAAAELRVKIAGKLSERITDAPENTHLQRQLQRLYLTKISTVHAFCADILREYAYKIDISPDFRVGDEAECIQLRAQAMEQVLEKAYAEIGSNTDFQALVDTQGIGRTDSLVMEIIEKVYDSACCHIDPKAWRDACIRSAEAADADDPAQTVWGKFLMDDLFSCLDGHIAAMDRCCASLEGITDALKPLQLLKDTVNQLRHLRQSTTWDEVSQRRNIDYGRLTFPKKLDAPELTEPIKAVRSACKASLDKKLKVFSDASLPVMEDLAASAPAARGLTALVDEFSQCYDRLKRMRRILDFSDLEHKTLQLLYGKRGSVPTVAAREIDQRFREIMVDEYQDSNGVQDAIFAALTASRQNLFMVGDVKQSIYQFRLADPGIFLEKYASFENAQDAAPGQGRKVLLSSNFRSSGGVIDAVNFVFENCMSRTVGGIDYGEEEALREGIAHIPLDETEIELHAIDVMQDTYAEEAAFVADRIATLLDGSHHVRDAEALRPIKPEDIVILLRSPGSVGLAFQDALEERGIPCASSGGMDLLLTEEVGTLRSLLQVISNPRQDIPLVAVLASPVFGFTANDLAMIRSNAKGCCFYEALTASKDERCKAFLDKLQLLRRSAMLDTLPGLLERIFHLTRLDTVYAAMPFGQQRRVNLQRFFELAVGFSALGSGGLDRFLQHLDSLQTRGMLAAPERSSSGCVTIMSIHKSKGLEFPVVFLSGLSRRFNQESLRQQVLCHKELGLGLSCVDSKNRVRYPTVSKSAIAAKISEESISEEMRVLYVAMTRARDRLIMTYASQSLDGDIQNLSLRMDLSSPELMHAEASCPGQWVLYSALKRTEAGALFALGGRPRNTVSVGAPWRITVCSVDTVDAQVMPEAEPCEELLPECDQEALRRNLTAPYPHIAATRTPTKQTATQRKGRIKDQEAAENAALPKQMSRDWRKPAFLAHEVRGTQYGSTIHAVMHYIRYACCTDPESISREIERLVQEGYITPEQGALVNTDKLCRFFLSDFGTRLRNAEHVLREFKFSILDDADEYGSDLQGEKVLLQGVVDCALIEPDGITIVDFKTDYVTAETVESVTAHYTPQVQTYAEALSRIYALPVKAAALYYFHTDSFAWL